MHPVSARMTPTSVWFWIVVGVGTAALVAIGRWLWVTQTNALREWFLAPKVAKENAAEARDSATAAAEHAEELKQTIGKKNGQGDLMSIATRLLVGQADMFAWQREHDAKDDKTRADVAEIKTHLGL